jgi:serine protease AprX
VSNATVRRFGVGSLGIVALAATVWFAVAQAAPREPLPAAQDAARFDKVSPALLAEASVEGVSEFILYLDEQADLRELGPHQARVERGALAVERLRAVAADAQADILASLAARGIEHRSFWVANLIWVRGDLNLALELAASTRVARVLPNTRVKMERPMVKATSLGPSGIEDSISHVGAPDVWALGFSGQGVVIGGADTGYQWDHPALVNQYRGWNGVSADHAYNWHDAIHSSNGPCGFDSPVPCDDDGHGTHTMGTMVGDDGGSNQIGMAPGARWIGCRNMDSGFGTPITYTECFQWFIAPTDEQDLNPNPALAPHVINNSWSCPPYEGCTDATILQTVVENVRAAGILVVVSAGNAGPACESIEFSPAIYDASFSVGATEFWWTNEWIASFSSRGPVSVDGSMRMKPDISAPGVDIRSSVPYDGYDIYYGTSMAAPHVAGLAALLISASPSLAGDVDGLETVITASAVPLVTSEGCGGDAIDDVPNNTFGHGRIDALAASELATQAPPPNDAWQNAITLTEGAAAGMLANATNDGSSTGGQPGQPDVWYTLTTAVDWAFSINTCGSNDLPGEDQGVDTVLSIHSAGPGTIANQLEANDNWPDGNDPTACTTNDLGLQPDSAVQMSLTAGQKVYIRVSRYDGSTDGDFVINLPEPNLLMQLGGGLGFLALLNRCRGRRKRVR